MVVLFDLDGTLVDSAGDLLVAAESLRKALDRPLFDPQELIKNISFGTDRMLEVAIGVSKESVEEKVWGIVKEGFYSAYRGTLFKNSVLYPGILDLLKELTSLDIAMGVVTNKHSIFAMPLIKHLTIDRYFSCVVTSDMVERPKPDPAAVRLAIDKIKDWNSADWWMVGDAKNDVLAGNSAGAKTVVALFGYVGDLTEVNAWPANYFIHHPNDLIPIIRSRLS